MICADTGSYTKVCAAAVNTRLSCMAVTWNSPACTLLARWADTICDTKEWITACIGGQPKGIIFTVSARVAAVAGNGRQGRWICTVKQNRHRKAGGEPPAFFILISQLMPVGILAAVPYCAYIDTLAVNIKIELIPLGKQCDMGWIFQV